jgi:hypothetical protein
MGKSIRSITEVLNGYLTGKNIGALFTDATLNEGRNQISKLAKEIGYFNAKGILSGKDCYFILSAIQQTVIKGKQQTIRTMNGLSSITYLSAPLWDTIASIQKLRGLEIAIITSNDCHPSIVATNEIVYDDIIVLSRTILNKLLGADSRKSDDYIEIKMRLGEELGQKKNDGKQRIVLIDPKFGQSASMLAALVYMNDSSQIIISSNSLRDQYSLQGGLSGKVELDDDSVSSPGKINSQANIENPLFRGHVTALINLYKRYDTVVEIYKSLIEQTFPISFIYVWVNEATDEQKINELRHKLPKARFVLSDENLGVWARFSFGLNIQTEYTVVFDDDTIPGVRWVENCLTTMASKEALLGTVGLIYESKSSYMSHSRYGWTSANEEPIVVDIVGHSWFFKTEWLKDYWYAKDDSCGLDFCGEDMHFSYALQKKGIPTIVPPHPISNPSLWGSLKAIEKGTGQEAISMSGKGSHMDLPLRRLIERGFRLQKFDTPSNSQGG